MGRKWGNPSVMGVLSQPPSWPKNWLLQPPTPACMPSGARSRGKAPGRFKARAPQQSDRGHLSFLRPLLEGGIQSANLVPRDRGADAVRAPGRRRPPAPRPENKAPRSARPRRSRPRPGAGGVPGRTVGNNGGLGRGRDRQVRPPPRPALTSSPLPQRPPLRRGPGAHPAARAGRDRAVRTRGHAPAPPRPPRGTGRWVQLRPCAPRAAASPRAPGCSSRGTRDAGRDLGCTQPFRHGGSTRAQRHAGHRQGRCAGGLGAYTRRTKGVAATHVGTPGSGRRLSEGQHGMFLELNMPSQSPGPQTTSHHEHTTQGIA